MISGVEKEIVSQSTITIEIGTTRTIPHMLLINRHLYNSMCVVKAIPCDICNVPFLYATFYTNGSIYNLWTFASSTLKSQYNGLTGRTDGAERQQLAFIQQWLFSPFLEPMGLHITWNYRIPTGICISHSHM